MGRRKRDGEQRVSGWELRGLGTATMGNVTEKMTFEYKPKGCRQRWDVGSREE